MSLYPHLTNLHSMLYYTPQRSVTTASPQVTEQLSNSSRTPSTRTTPTTDCSVSGGGGGRPSRGATAAETPMPKPRHASSGAWVRSAPASQEGSVSMPSETSLSDWDNDDDSDGGVSLRSVSTGLELDIRDAQMEAGWDAEIFRRAGLDECPRCGLFSIRIEKHQCKCKSEPPRARGWTR